MSATVFILAWWFFSPFVSQSPAPGLAYYQQTETETPTLTATEEETATPTPIDSFLPLVNKDYPPTPTPTGTPPTLTPTPTGGTPTPTATGTITPNLAAVKSVSPIPAEARIGQNLTFTIRLTNSGTAPASNVVLTDSFTPYPFIDIFSLSSSSPSSTVSTSGRTASVNIGALNPGATETITIVIRINNSATTTTFPSNTASVTYTHLGSPQTRFSNQVSFRVIGSTTLPPTGEMPLEVQPEYPDWPRLFRSLALGLFGASLLVYNLLSRRRRPSSPFTLGITGLVVSGVALLSGLSALGFLRPAGSEGALDPYPLLQGPPAIGAITPLPEGTRHPLERLPAYLFATPHFTPELLETLPDYPVPTPSVQPGQGYDPSAPDTSPVVRINIPALEVEAVVKYVPFDGHSWLISGLRDEVAWLGDTSWPGLGGNTALAGHITVRDLGDGPFRYLEQLAFGDEVRLHTERNVYTYRVREQAVVEETDLSVTAQTEVSQLTLVTCTDWNDDLRLYLKRLIVFADLVKVEPAFAIGSN